MLSVGPNQSYITADLYGTILTCSLHLVLAALGTIGGMLFGFEISSMSAWIGATQYMEFFDHPSSTQQGGITASMSGGSLIGALAAGWISDRLGRKGAIQIAAIIWIVGAILQCSSQNVAHLVVGRIVGGLAIGITSSQCLVYLAELAPSRTRGGIVGIQQWSIEWGGWLFPKHSWLHSPLTYFLLTRHSDHVFDLIRMRQDYLGPICFPCCLGYPGSSWCHSLRRPVLLP